MIVSLGAMGCGLLSAGIGFVQHDAIVVLIGIFIMAFAGIFSLVEGM